MKTRRFLFLIQTVLGIFFAFSCNSRPSSLIKIPIDFTYHLLKPLIKIEIESRNYNILVDSGSNSNEFIFEKDILEKIKEKEKLGDYEIGDFRGNSYLCHAYRVPQINVGNITVTDSNVIEQNHDYHFNVQFWPVANIEKLIKKRNEQIKGNIGLPFFQNYNCLFNFPESEIVLQKNSEKLEELCPINDYICVPFSLEACGIVFNIQTDAGNQRMILDTGATYSVINSCIPKLDKIKEIEEGSREWYYPTNTLTIGGCNYGTWDFALFDIAEEFEVDGALGADFFLEHGIGVDFQNKKVYIKIPENTLRTQWKRLKIRTNQFLKRVISYVHFQM